MSLIAGFLTGTAASMGLGGGAVLIVYLTLFKNTPQLAAQGANLLFFLPTALFSTIINTRGGLVEWRLIPFAAIAGIAGAAIGTALGALIDETVLCRLFAALLAVTGAKELFHRKKPRRDNLKK